MDVQGGALSSSGRAALPQPAQGRRPVCARSAHRLCNAKSCAGFGAFGRRARCVRLCGELEGRASRSHDPVSGEQGPPAHRGVCQCGNRASVFWQPAHDSICPRMPVRQQRHAARLGAASRRSRVPRTLQVWSRAIHRTARAALLLRRETSISGVRSRVRSSRWDSPGASSRIHTPSPPCCARQHASQRR